MTRPADLPAFLEHRGAMGALMRAHDWSESPLGTPATWPPALVTAVGLMLDSKFPMFVAYGPQLGLLYNEAYAEILGRKHPAALGRPFQVVWSEIWPALLPIVEQAMAGQASFHENLPLSMLRKGYEEQTWFTFSYSPLRDESGAVRGMFCACTETTQQVLAERHLAAQHQRMRQMFQQAPGIIAVLREPSHIFEFANDAYLRLVGNREVLGKPVSEALPEIAGQRFLALLDHVYRTGEPYVGRAAAVMLRRQPDVPLEERFVDFVYQPIRDERGHVSGIFVEGSDVTDAIRTNQALRESELRLRQLANTIPQLAWIADREGQVHWYNDRWFEFTGMPRNTGGAGNWQEYIHPEDVVPLVQKWQLALATGEPYEATARMRGAEGDVRVFYVSAAPLRDSAGQIVQWFGTNTDVTPIEAARNELRTANRRKDEFLAMLAHELRNPLAPISAAAQLLKLGAHDEDRVRQTSDVIARQVNHMAQLVDDLLDVSRVTRGLVQIRNEILDVGALLADALEQTQSLIAAKHHHFTMQVPDGAVFVRGDRTRLIQIFSNLLNNAAKYTPPHGHIALRLSAGEDDVEVAVVDDGVGIDPGLLPHVFELFTQAERSPDRSQGGLGLGLALVKSLSELHGGSVFARSEGRGRGSEFIVRLARSVIRQGGLPPTSAANEPRRQSDASLLMIVDDNVDAAGMLKLLLEASGHRVLVAHNAQDALALVAQTAPAILFLDIGLPDMDGYQLARHLRALPETASSLLVAVTGYGQPEDKSRALEAGFAHHLVKPVRFDAVLDLLATVAQ
jgi:PAS domain S-box-containing protein